MSFFPFLPLVCVPISYNISSCFPYLKCSGDHLEEVADMIVSKFGVNGDAVFLDLDGEFVPFGG